MTDTKILENIDTELIKYLNKLIEENYFGLVRSSVVIIGRLDDGRMMPNFYESEQSVKDDSERISRNFEGEVLVYFLKENKFKSCSSLSVADTISEHELERIVERSEQDD